MYTEATYVLSDLLEKSLENLLQTLQRSLSARKRDDWPVICLALLLMFFAVVSMQVDIYLRSSKVPIMCEGMEMRSILVLAKFLKLAQQASTHGA